MKNNKILNDPYCWANEAKLFPQKGTGLEYYKREMEDDKWIDCLLYYGQENQLEGILYYYPFDFSPFESKGDFHLYIDPNITGTVVPSELLDEAIVRFKIDFDDHLYFRHEEYYIRGYLLVEAQCKLLDTDKINGIGGKGKSYITELISEELNRMEFHD